MKSFLNNRFLIVGLISFLFISLFANIYLYSQLKKSKSVQLLILKKELAGYGQALRELKGVVLDSSISSDHYTVSKVMLHETSNNINILMENYLSIPGYGFYDYTDNLRIKTEQIVRNRKRPKEDVDTLINSIDSVYETLRIIANTNNEEQIKNLLQKFPAAIKR